MFNNNSRSRSESRSVSIRYSSDRSQSPPRIRIISSNIESSNRFRTPPRQIRVPHTITWAPKAVKASRTYLMSDESKSFCRPLCLSPNKLNTNMQLHFPVPPLNLGLSQLTINTFSNDMKSNDIKNNFSQMNTLEKSMSELTTSISSNKTIQDEKVNHTIISLLNNPYNLMDTSSD